MTHMTIFKAPIFLTAAFALMAGGFSACKAPPPKAKQYIVDTETKFLPLRKTLECLPRKAAMIAAHRGTDENWNDIAENSIGGLKALIDHGTKMAEIDVAGLKDGTLITFHDGVWDDISTGKGPIASSRLSDLDSILLKSRKGGLTSDRPPLFTDMLKTAKGKIYLEIDFKSSADPKAVIQAIRKAGMADHVLLIAYNPKQASQFEHLAPEMLRSNPTAAAQKGHAVWLGYNVGDGNTATSLKQKGNFIIGRIGDPSRQPSLNVLTRTADILVTDKAERYDGVIGLSRNDLAEYVACLAK